MGPGIRADGPLQHHPADRPGRRGGAPVRHWGRDGRAQLRVVAGARRAGAVDPAVLRRHGDLRPVAAQLWTAARPGSLVRPALRPSVWVVALLAAALAHQLRRIIDVESGLNDGLATPLVLFFLAGALASGGPAGGEAPLVHALAELAVGVVVGVVLGAAGGRLLVSARRTRWSSPAGERLAVVVLPVLTYLTAVALGGNGFIAAFVAGIAAGTLGRDEVAEEQLQLTNDVGTLVSAAVWFIFGTLIPAVVARGISWNVLLYAVLSLTIVRMLPVALALVRSGLGAREVLFLGWIGPRGLASILFGLIAIEDLHTHGLTAAADSVAEVIVVTVGLSVLLHGLTAGVIAARWPTEPTEPQQACVLPEQPPAPTANPQASKPST